MPRLASGGEREWSDRFAGCRRVGDASPTRRFVTNTELQAGYPGFFDGMVIASDPADGFNPKRRVIYGEHGFDFC